MLKKSYYFFPVLIVFAFLSHIRPLYAYDSRFSYLPKDKATHLKNLCTITNLAQTATWLNEEELAIGRWRFMYDRCIERYHCSSSKIQ